MAFKGWPAEAIEFFERLERDNTKEFWQANKSTYETCVRAPMEELLVELAPEFGGGKIYRPYRDVRFSKDKTPYKTYISAPLTGGGYISLSADGLGAGSGYYMLAADQLDRYRRAVDSDRTGAELATLVAKARRAKMDISAHDMLKRAPRGYDNDHPRAELLRHKGLIAWRQWPVGPWLSTKTAKTRIVDFLHAARPLCDWLDKNVGRSTEPEPARR